MNRALKYLIVILMSAFAWADNYWMQKKTNFEKHSKEFQQRKTNKLKIKTKYIQNKHISDLEKPQLKWAFLENQLQQDNRGKAQQLLNLFTTQKQNRKTNIKRKFIQTRNKNKKLKEKYKIPLEDQLFL